VVLGCYGAGDRGHRGVWEGGSVSHCCAIDGAIDLTDLPTQGSKNIAVYRLAMASRRAISLRASLTDFCLFRVLQWCGDSLTDLASVISGRPIQNCHHTNNAGTRRENGSRNRRMVSFGLTALGQVAACGCCKIGCSITLACSKR
jgi:hypothetical protein